MFPPLPMKVDPKLIKDCKRGKNKAQHELYRICFDHMIGICMRYHNNKEDAIASLNLAFYRVLDQLDKFEKDVSFIGWIKTITVRTLINEFHKNKKYKENFLQLNEEEAPKAWGRNEEDHINDKIDAESLLVLLHQLPDAQKQVMNLYAIDGYQHKEIAEMLGIAEGTSRWLLAKARQKMKDLIELENNRLNSAIEWRAIKTK